MPTFPVFAGPVTYKHKQKKIQDKNHCIMVLQQIYCHDVDVGQYRNILYRWLPLIDPCEENFISKVCLRGY